ncbi:MAG: helix-turn-helix transcriptional regulator [Thermodesulfovibrionales bacterium]
MMFITRLITEFGEYHYTPDYVRGVLVEITGILIEVLLLSIAVPVIFYFVRRVRTRPIRAMVDFYLFQIFHKVTRMFLRMASISDLMPIIAEEQKHNPKFEIYSHFVYGNLENILFVLKRTFAKGDTFRTEVDKRSIDDFKEFRTISDRCLEEIDRLAAMLVGVPDIQQELFQMRILVYPLRDLYDEVITDIKDSEKEPFRRNLHSYDVQQQAEQLTTIIDSIFTKRRKLIDSMMKHQQWRSYAQLFLSIVRRWAQIRICRFRRRPYRDFIAPSPVPDMLQEWRERDQMSREQAAQTLGIPVREYSDYENGYRQPAMHLWEKVKPYLRKANDVIKEKQRTEQSTPPYSENHGGSPQG